MVNHLQNFVNPEKFNLRMEEDVNKYTIHTQNV